MKGAADTYEGRGLIADPIHQYILYTRPGGIAGEATEQDVIDTSWAPAAAPHSPAAVGALGVSRRRA